jgi:hypothetical protein
LSLPLREEHETKKKVVLGKIYGWGGGEGQEEDEKNEKLRNMYTS